MTIEQPTSESQFQRAEQFEQAKRYKSAGIYYRNLAIKGCAAASRRIMNMIAEGHLKAEIGNYEQGLPDPSVPLTIGDVFNVQLRAYYGYCEFQILLSDMYADGMVVKQNVVEAWIWHHIAFKNNCKKAEHHQTTLDKQLNEKQKKEAKEEAQRRWNKICARWLS